MMMMPPHTYTQHYRSIARLGWRDAWQFMLTLLQLPLRYFQDGCEEQHELFPTLL